MALFFGAPTGFVINYDPDRAVRYDLEGRALEILRGAVKLGETSGECPWAFGISGVRVGLRSTYSSLLPTNSLGSL